MKKSNQGTKGSTNKQSKNSNAKSGKEMDRREQKSTNGGSLLGDDNSTLTLAGGLGIHSSHTDDDGETESSSFGTNFGAGGQSNSND
jgi:hypothetical protein